MENYDLSVITRDKLHLLLSTAEVEVVKYINYHEEAEKNRNALKRRDDDSPGCLASAISFIICFMSVILFWVFSKYKFTSLLWVHAVPFSISVGLIIFYQKFSKEYDENQLQDLEKKEREALNEFKAALFIPDDYCNKYALTTMLKFIDNKRADSWREVTYLYEEHMHRMTMENNTRLILEELKQQTEYLNSVRTRAGWAAAGTWAAAAGIWNK